jgi:UDP-2,4-diacetamido-2,4,6-trideoxy-beta-L-altropyranose hydrolase
MSTENRNIGHLVIRADASVAMGTGHAMRCLALAQAWQDAGGRAAFAMAEATSAVEERLRSEDVEVLHIPAIPGSQEDSGQTARLAAMHEAAWVAVDGYQFGAEYQLALERASCKVLFLDDNGHAGRYAADVILDQNPNVPESAYRERDSRSRLLLGLKFVLLRREFAASPQWERHFPATGRRILITMGGSDPDNLTLHALGASIRTGIENLEITVVVGGSNPHLAALEKSAEANGSHVRLLCDAKQMPEVLANSDLAIIAAGGTLWEALFMRCAVLSYARNAVQDAIIDHLQTAGAAIRLASADEEKVTQAVRQVVCSEDLRASLATKGRELVDGEGAKRVAAVLLGKDDPQ